MLLIEKEYVFNTDHELISKNNYNLHSDEHVIHTVT